MYGRTLVLLLVTESGAKKADDNQQSTCADNINRQKNYSRSRNRINKMDDVLLWSLNDAAH